MGILEETFLASRSAMAVSVAVGAIENVRRGMAIRDVERGLQIAWFKGVQRIRVMALAKCRQTAERGLWRAEASSEGGFSILEVLVATTIVTVAVAALAQLFALATRANASAKAATYTSVLAQQKMEQLRGLTWGFDVLGLPMTDTTTNLTVVPETAVGGKGLSPSPENSLGTNTEGYCDFVDKFGRPLGGGTAPPAGTAYIRRWSVEPLPANANNTIVLQVLVTPSPGRNDVDTSSTGARAPDEARLVSVKTRKAS